MDGQLYVVVISPIAGVRETAFGPFDEGGMYNFQDSFARNHPEATSEAMLLAPRLISGTLSASHAG